MEQTSMFDDNYKDICQKLTNLISEVNRYDCEILGLNMSRDSALRQIYELVISVPMDNRREFTKHLMVDQQTVMVEAIAKNAARAYIYGARPKEDNGDAQIPVR